MDGSVPRQRDFYTCVKINVNKCVINPTIGNNPTGALSLTIFYHSRLEAVRPQHSELDLCLWSCKRTPLSS